MDIISDSVNCSRVRVRLLTESRVVLPVGTKHTWKDGKTYIKTDKGWVSSDGTTTHHHDTPDLIAKLNASSSPRMRAFADKVKSALGDREKLSDLLKQAREHAAAAPYPSSRHPWLHTVEKLQNELARLDQINHSAETDHAASRASEIDNANKLHADKLAARDKWLKSPEFDKHIDQLEKEMIRVPKQAKHLRSAIDRLRAEAKRAHNK